MKKFIILFFISIIFTGCSFINDQTSQKTTEDEFLTYSSEEFGFSIQYPSHFGTAWENWYKNQEIIAVKFLDSNEGASELELSPSDFNMPLDCDNFSEGDFISGEIRIDGCERLNVDNRMVIIVTSTVTVMGGSTGKIVLFETEKGVWSLSAPEEYLISIAETLRYVQ